MKVVLLKSVDKNIVKGSLSFFWQETYNNQ